MDKTIKRGDIYYADLNPVVGSEQGGTRPVQCIWSTAEVGATQRRLNLW